MDKETLRVQELLEAFFNPPPAPKTPPPAPTSPSSQTRPKLNPAAPIFSPSPLPTKAGSNERQDNTTTTKVCPHCMGSGKMTLLGVEKGSIGDGSGSNGGDGK